MIHEALDKRGREESTPTANTPVPSKTQRLKASLIVPIRIVHAIPMEDVALVNAFGGFAPPPVVAPILADPLALETPLTVRVGYEPSAEFDVDGITKSVDDQLRMSPGDMVIINETFDDGWAVGTNLTSGLAGLFPVTVVKFIPIGTALPNVPLPVKPAPIPETDRELEKRKLKEQMEQMQAMMQMLQAKLEQL
ncbi:hypothetical protein BCR33DRAFT_712871 [Rhizoclosmatium globosum]|uniref:SH3 domain-containing protein n=1 Tax=Rhizoclosmatium globosum TaxID=329046 RepID=A0A1Y2CV22_9FUNG|nr:hypothetical protein BCR33DRAFT_712871 [Rhizoclosmatium globosum]|eukprot:ORY50910.1 hypothetical protein BCR33DRAFT_712871 [Rhizoclosmatium globosum]